MIQPLTSQGPWVKRITIIDEIHIFEKSNILRWYSVFNQEKRGSWIANSYYSTKRFSNICREKKPFPTFFPTIFTWFKRHCIINRFLWGPFNVRKPFSSYIAAKKVVPKENKNNPLKSTVSKVQKLGERRTFIRIRKPSRGIIFENTNVHGFFGTFLPNFNFSKQLHYAFFINNEISLPPP